MQLSRNISYKSFLLYAFACSIILMNFSLSCSNTNPGWACSINLSRGPLASIRPGQPTQKCSSLSTMPELHTLHDLSSTGRQTYLLISVYSGTVPPLYRSVEICVLWLLFSVRIPESRHSLLCVQCTISTLFYLQCRISNSPSPGGRDSC